MNGTLGESYVLWKYEEAGYSRSVMLTMFPNGWWVHLQSGDDPEDGWVSGGKLSDFANLVEAVEFYIDGLLPVDKTPYYTDDYFKLISKM